MGLKRHFRLAADTALHAGKDLIVAPSDFASGKPQAYTETYPLRDTFALSLEGVSVGTSILADDGRYPLPIFPPEAGSMFGLSSLRPPKDGQRAIA